MQTPHRSHAKSPLARRGIRAHVESIPKGAVIRRRVARVPVASKGEQSYVTLACDEGDQKGQKGRVLGCRGQSESEVCRAGQHVQAIVDAQAQGSDVYISVVLPTPPFELEHAMMRVAM